jgi:hypothetical protein
MTPSNIPQHERKHLRELARRQADIAALSVMEERRQMWVDLNDKGAGSRPPVIIETGTFNREFMPESLFKCQTPDGRKIEEQLLRNIRNHELIADDKVIPNTFDIGWFVDIDPLGIQIERETADDAQGIAAGYLFIHPIKDIKEDLHMLKPPRCTVDRESTMQWKACLEELLGDLLPVEIRSGVFGSTMLTQNVIQLMGMEAFFLAMYDSPDEVHQLMATLRDGCMTVMRWAEEEGLLCLNNGNQASFGSSFNFTNKLPAREIEGRPVKLCDMWGASNSQETVGVSPEMFHEFCFPYYRDVCAPMGLVYYGCCEPVDPFWSDIKNLPHLKKVSISRWASEPFMGEALRGTDIVYSRKPDPNFLGVDVQLDEEAWARHIRKTLEATKEVGLEFIIRDVYTVHGNLENAKRAVEIARHEIDRNYAP